MVIKRSTNSPSALPIAQSAISKPSFELETNVSNTDLSTNEDTLRGGNLLGVVRPYWMKVTESEQRLAWLKTMRGRDLVVRDLESYAKSISEQLRSEQYRMREEERKILLEIMSLKIKDEKKHLVEVKRKKEERKRWLIDQLGKNRKFDTIIRKLRKETLARKAKLKRKYFNKIAHLEQERKKEIIEKRKALPILSEILDYKECWIFDERKMEQIKEDDVKVIKIGDVKLDDDEASILKLHPNFAVLTRLDDETVEREIELGVTKLRYEVRKLEEKEALEEVTDKSRNAKRSRKDDTDNSDNVNLDEEIEIQEAKERQLFDPIKKVFDFSKRRATDCKENSKVYLRERAGEQPEEYRTFAIIQLHCHKFPCVYLSNKVKLNIKF